MSILLTGGTGYIGSHAAIVLIEAGFDVVLFDNLSNSHPDVVNRIEKITSKKVSFVHGDVRDTDFLSSTIKNFQIDSVIHFAGLKAVGESVSEPLKYFDCNVGGAISLLKAMQKNNINQLIFSSSATVYGDPTYLPIDEAHPKSALNPYGQTKLMIEEILKNLVASDPNFKIIALRYFNPVGAHNSGLIGESPKAIPNNLLPYIADVAFGKLPNLSVFGCDYQTLDGTGIRDYIHVMDIAEGHLAALKFISKNKGWNVFNLGTGEGKSVLEVIQAYSEINNVQVPYSIVERRPGDVASIYASAVNANNKLNWKAKRNLNEMCKSSWIWRVNLEKVKHD